MSDHTTADDASRYRAKERLEEQALYDPISRLRTYLIRSDLLTEQGAETIEAECADEVEAAVKEYLATPAPPSSAMFDYLYETLPTSLAAQREFATKRGSGNA
jgi:pyruvate dehydrogenase E1 component alpha subunit